jgi:hypothetical protein
VLEAWSPAPSRIPPDCISRQRTQRKPLDGAECRGSASTITGTKLFGEARAGCGRPVRRDAPAAIDRFSPANRGISGTSMATAAATPGPEHWRCNRATAGRRLISVVEAVEDELARLEEPGLPPRVPRHVMCGGR